MVRQHLQQIVIAWHWVFFREPAPCIFQGSKSSCYYETTHTPPQVLIVNMFDNSWISISKIKLIIISINRQLRLFDEIEWESFMKILNNKGPKMEPRGTPLLTYEISLVTDNLSLVWKRPLCVRVYMWIVKHMITAQPSLGYFPRRCIIWLIFSGL